MAVDQIGDELAARTGQWDGEEETEAVSVRRPRQEASELDITPMIDIVFLLLIFFLVASTPDTERMVELPPARYGTGVLEDSSVVITVAEEGRNRPPAVYLMDGKIGPPLTTDPALQEAEIVRAVENGLRIEGKSTVLIKAERTGKYREVSRIASAASQVEGIRLYLGVMEVE